MSRHAQVTASTWESLGAVSDAMEWPWKLSRGDRMEHELKHLEEVIAKVRSVDNEHYVIALDSLAFVASNVAEEASKRWSEITDRQWDRWMD